MGWLRFNGVSSDDMGIKVSGRGTFNAPSKSYELVSIPHRNGDIIMDNDRYENIEVTYPAIFLLDNYALHKRQVRDWLNSAKGYQVLQDSYNTDEYRLACFKDMVNITDYYFEAGEMDIIFNCRPERFLLSGNTVTTITGSSGSITNPTNFSAKPLIKVNGYGTFTIKDHANTKTYTITISQQYNYVNIDSDQMQCYFGNSNANMYVQIDEFPLLVPGVNDISIVDNSIASIEITPRWWRI